VKDQVNMTFRIKKDERVHELEKLHSNRFQIFKMMVWSWEGG
jgi:hypothetical protein